MNEKPMASTRPHIILFLSAHHNATVMGGAGDPWVQTPHLDALAGAGCRFSNAYCNSPVCGPSRMSLLTGQSPLRNGVLTNRQALASHIPTFAHSLAAAGYDTVLSGRMHFIGADQQHGFAERLVGDIGPIDPAFTEIEAGRFNHSTGQGKETLAFNGPGHCPANQYDREVVNAACDRIQKQDPAKPLFMVVGTYAPHNPYVCSPEVFAKYQKRLPLPDLKAIKEAHQTAHPGLRAWLEARDMLDPDPAEIHRARIGYYGMVEEMDRQIGQLSKVVEEHLNFDRTYFGYTSDHGDLVGHHGMFWKSCFLEGAVKVPLLWRGPGIAPQRTSDDLVSLLDLAPTLTKWADAPALPEAEGQSLAPLMASEPDTPPPERCIHSVLVDPRTGPSLMLRKGPYKAVFYGRYPEPQWADLRKDDVWEAKAEPPPVDFVKNIPAEWDAPALETTDQQIKANAPIFRAARTQPQASPAYQWSPNPQQFSLANIEKE
ncbi:MAG: sulfatase-like hydrolase/transferase [Opitutales bacterium]|nr:sulfatase-like hydrolase/transferase [Opitutales bacterium]